jgi:hypothetical protein
VQRTEGHGFSRAAKAGLGPLCSGRKGTGLAVPQSSAARVALATEVRFLGLLGRRSTISRWRYQAACLGQEPSLSPASPQVDGDCFRFRRMRSYSCKRCSYTAGKATTSCMHLLSCPITFIFCLPHKGRRSNASWHSSRVATRTNSVQSNQSGNAASQIIAFAMQKTSKQGGSTSIRIL